MDIATPASNAPDSDYATSAQDVVINVLAKALSAIEGFGSPLPSNEDFPNSGAFDILGHGITEVYLNPQVDTTNVVPALIASAESTLPSGPVPIIAGAITNLPASGTFGVQKPDGSIVYPHGEFVADSSDIEPGTYVFGAQIGNPNDCFAGGWSGQIVYLTDTLPTGSGATSGGGGFNQVACAGGTFEPLLSVTVAADAANGGYAITAH